MSVRRAKPLRWRRRVDSSRGAFWSCALLVAFGLGAGCGHAGKGYLSASLSAACTPRQVRAGRAVSIDVKVINTSGVTWPHTFTELDADHFEGNQLADLTAGSSPGVNVIDDRYRHAPTKAGGFKEFVGSFIARYPGNARLVATAWGDTDPQGRHGGGAKSAACSVRINP